MKVRNTFIIFIVSGFWHGANWTFIIWGVLNALYFLPLLVLNRNRVNTNTVAEHSLFINIKELAQITLTFFLTLMAWVFFRAETVSIAVSYINGIFSRSIINLPTVDLKPILFIVILVLVEWLNRKEQHGLVLNSIKFTPMRWAIYIVIFSLILIFGAQSQSFIYFQF